MITTIADDRHVQMTPRFRAALAHRDDHVRGSAREVLDRMGADVIDVSNGAPLAALIAEHRVDVAIAGDELGGVDVLRDCRRRGGTTPFVILSRAIDDVLWCAIHLKLVSLVSTPFVPDTLIAAIRAVRGARPPAYA
jgi:DNA-binding response OmpR family regulator